MKNPVAKAAAQIARVLNTLPTEDHEVALAWASERALTSPVKPKRRKRRVKTPTATPSPAVSKPAAARKPTTRKPVARRKPQPEPDEDDESDT